MSSGKAACIITGDVHVKLTVSPLHSWVAAEHSGIILYGHCTCIEEVCSHTAALLFTAEINNINADKHILYIFTLYVASINAKGRLFTYL